MCRSRRELSNEYLLFSTCKIWLRYSRERAYLISLILIRPWSFNFHRALQPGIHTTRAARCLAGSDRDVPRTWEVMYLCRAYAEHGIFLRAKNFDCKESELPVAQPFYRWVVAVVGCESDFPAVEIVLGCTAPRDCCSGATSHSRVGSAIFGKFKRSID